MEIKSFGGLLYTAVADRHPFGSHTSYSRPIKVVRAPYVLLPPPEPFLVRLKTGYADVRFGDFPIVAGHVVGIHLNDDGNGVLVHLRLPPGQASRGEAPFGTGWPACRLESIDPDGHASGVPHEFRDALVSYTADEIPDCFSLLC